MGGGPGRGEREMGAVGAAGGQRKSWRPSRKSCSWVSGILWKTGRGGGGQGWAPQLGGSEHLVTGDTWTEGRLLRRDPSGGGWPRPLPLNEQ